MQITATRTDCTPQDVQALIARLDTQRGVMLTSRYEYPGRYTRWDIATVNPPIVLEVVGSYLRITALNERGRVLLPVFQQVVSDIDFTLDVSNEQDSCSFVVLAGTYTFMEEDRSKMPHVMNVIRALRNEFYDHDSHLGFYGIFGYDLGIDFMGVQRKLERGVERDLVLYFADEVFVTDHEHNDSYVMRYEFETANGSTSGLDRTGEEHPYVAADGEASRDMPEGAYADIVREASEYFARGDLFEVVPSQAFHEPCHASPATVFNRLLDVNPAPYGALINLGESEWTISASPEMFVRVEGDRVESCPIAGTIARGSGDISDDDQIEKLLGSEKEASELTMCTDVDRNDKSRVCVPGSVKVIGRRQIEVYSRLIHTVDHVEGILEIGYDAIDAFLTHMWAVTVTGAPKMWAMRFIEEHETSPRRFYGAAMGFIGVNGNMNTGLMLRSVHVHSGMMHIRVGATLLAASDPTEEERETELKASAMLDVVRTCERESRG